MDMLVHMPARAEGAVNSPYGIGKAKGDQEPSGNLTAERLDGFDAKDSAPIAMPTNQDDRTRIWPSPQK
jgi:hypothetical protein